MNIHCLGLSDRLVGLVIKASASRVDSPGFDFRLRGGSSHTSDLQTGTPVATLLGARRYGVSAGIGLDLFATCCDWVRWKIRYATSLSV